MRYGSAREGMVMSSSITIRDALPSERRPSPAEVFKGSCVFQKPQGHSESFLRIAESRCGSPARLFTAVTLSSASRQR
jgi:hypothetical protein